MCNVIMHVQVTRYRDARYVTTSEAVWRTMQFTMSDMYPKVIRLTVHDEDEQEVWCNKHK